MSRALLQPIPVTGALREDSTHHDHGAMANPSDNQETLHRQLSSDGINNNRSDKSDGNNNNGNDSNDRESGNPFKALFASDDDSYDDGDDIKKSPPHYRDDGHMSPPPLDAADAIWQQRRSRMIGRDLELAYRYGNSFPKEQFNHQVDILARRMAKVRYFKDHSGQGNFRGMKKKSRLCRSDAINVVRERWQEQGIWKSYWTTHIGDDQRFWSIRIGGDRWPHEEPLAAPPSTPSSSDLFPPGSVPDANAARPVNDPPAACRRTVEASRPYAQFVYQVTKERDFLLGHAHELQDQSTPRLEADAPGPAELSLDGAPEDINSRAYESVKAMWMRWHIWDKRWGVMPGQRWQHEESLMVHTRRAIVAEFGPDDYAKLYGPFEDADGNPRGYTPGGYVGTFVPSGVIVAVLEAREAKFSHGPWTGHMPPPDRYAPTFMTVSSSGIPSDRPAKADIGSRLLLTADGRQIMRPPPTPAAESRADNAGQTVAPTQGSDNALAPASPDDLPQVPKDKGPESKETLRRQSTHATASACPPGTETIPQSRKRTADEDEAHNSTSREGENEEASSSSTLDFSSEDRPSAAKRRRVGG